MNRPKAKRRYWIPGLILLISLGIAILGLLRYRRRLGAQARTSTAGLAPDFQQFQGLTEAEAESRRSPSLDQEQKQDARKVRRAIWRTSIFSIFNLGMLGLAAVQILLRDTLSALGTLLILVLSIILTAVQQLYATGRVEKLLGQARPWATVVRDGRIRSIELDDVVLDDVLLVGPGDQFLVDGKLLTSTPLRIRSFISGAESQDTLKGEGDLVEAGRFCVDGRGAYQVTALQERSAAGWSPVPQGLQALTPLQRIMDRLLRALLLVIAVFLALLLLDMINFPYLPDQVEALYRETASVLFSIAPSGLFFMIIVTYALGSARLGDTGALVRDSRAVESLAQVSVLSFSKTGALTGAEVQLEMATPANGRPLLAESRVRQLLGDVAHSAHSDNIFLQAIAESFAGSRRAIIEEAWFLSVYGWSAVTFAEVDVPGTYIIGDEAILQAHLEEEDLSVADGEEADEPLSGLRERIADLGRLFQRQEADEPSLNPTENEQPDDEPAEEGDALFQRLRDQLDGLIQPAAEVEPATEQLQLLFVYSPEPRPLYDPTGQPKLPDDLIPLATLSFAEQLRPEAVEAVSAFTESGVRVALLSSDDPAAALEAARQLGFAAEGEEPANVVSGRDLALMTEEQVDALVRKSDIFAELIPEQKGNLVDRLRHQEERVAMVGDALGDVPAMQQANLGITLQSSSQAALNLADIVLLKDSLQVLPATLQQGQRIVNGLLDILKINVTQVGYVFLLIIFLFFIDDRLNFYYHPTHGGVIAFFTVIAPSLGLTFWASAGALPRQYMRSRLWHFIVPAAISMAIAALAINALVFRISSNVAETELAVTYGLILMGLLLVVFVQPPTRAWVGGDVLSGDWRNTYMALGLFIFYNIVVWVPLAQNLLRLAPLAELWEYAIIGLVVLVWLPILRAVWRAPWLNRYVGILSARLERT